MMNMKKAAPIMSRLSEQLTCCAVCTCEIKHEQNSRYQAGGQRCQSGGRPLDDLISLGRFAKKSSIASFFTGFSTGSGGCISLARASSCWRAMIPCKSSLLCSAKISSADLYFLLIGPSCKAMRRSTSHHSADSDYSDSLVLRRWSSSRATVTICPISSAALTPICSTLARALSDETRGFSPLPSAWRRAISPRTAVITKDAIVSSFVFRFSIPSITSCGNLMFFICERLLMFPVAMLITCCCVVYIHYIKICMNKTIDTEAHLFLICVYTNKSGVYTTKPRTVGPVTGLLTTNTKRGILWLP